MQTTNQIVSFDLDLSSEKMATIDASRVQYASKILKDSDEPLKKRFRALFTLRNLGGKDAVDSIYDVIRQDKSALLKHECCYCLGQMAESSAIEYMTQVLQNQDEHAVVRHEAAEALGNLILTDQSALTELLQQFKQDANLIVSQTCELALDLIDWRRSTAQELQAELAKQNAYASKDPAPSFDSGTSDDRLKAILLDPQSKLFDKYRALFTLRNVGSEAAVRTLGETLLHYKHDDSMALFKHEIGYIYGQMQSPHSIEYLRQILECRSEDDIVRHEAAEALGSVATIESLETLKPFLTDEALLVRQSVEVALDMIDYEHDDSQFHFLA
jgi:deoxyhypusine monooxygenase